MTIPNWYELLLLGLAAYRTWKLLAEDVILDRPRAWIVGLSDWTAGQRTPASYREGLAEFITCPWCFGAWNAIGWWGLWQAFPHFALVAAVPFAISVVVGSIASVLPDD